MVPDEGNSEIVKLHDKLYTGILNDELRLDIPFIPHIGFGGSVNPNESKSIADELNKSNFNVYGNIDKLAVVSYNYPKVETLEEIKLL